MRIALKWIKNHEVSGSNLSRGNNIGNSSHLSKPRWTELPILVIVGGNPWKKSRYDKLPGIKQLSKEINDRRLTNVQKGLSCKTTEVKSMSEPLTNAFPDTKGLGNSWFSRASTTCFLLLNFFGGRTSSILVSVSSFILEEVIPLLIWFNVGLGVPKWRDIWYNWHRSKWLYCLMMKSFE